MRRRDDYLLYQKDGMILLLPSGQAMANDNRALRLNETALFLWNRLEQEVTEDALLDSLRSEYSNVPMSTLKADLESFIRLLRERKLILEHV